MPQNLDARTIWGKVILYLKDRKLISTYIACGDITNVEIENGKLIIKNDDNFLINVITEGIADIKNALSWQGIMLDVEVQKVDKTQTQKQQNLQIIKQFVSDDYII